MLSQKNLLSNALTLSKSWGFTVSDVLLHALPIYHTHGLFVATNIALASGSQIRFLKKFDEDDIIANLPYSTVMMGVPTFYTRLLANRKFNKEITKNMRLFISGSAPLLKETHEKFQYVTEHKILERYGMTETNMITSNPYNGERKAGTVGLALQDVKVRVAALENGKKALKNGEIGVVEVMGPNVFKGYWKQPEKTKSEFRDDGFFITGDLGYLDQDNYLTIVGRNKDLIITGGLNVYPKEIEIIIDRDINVEESAVIGVSHPDFGEGVVAIIVEKKGHKLDHQILQEDLKKIKESAVHQLGLINEILDHSKIEAGKLELYLAEFELSESLTFIKSISEPLAGKTLTQFNMTLTMTWALCIVMKPGFDKAF